MDFLKPEFYFDLSAFPHKALWKEGEPVWSALHSLKHFFTSSGKIEIEIPTTVHLKYPDLISIGKGTVIEPGVMIVGPCIIGENCTIRHGAYLRENVILGNHCSIGHCAELKNSILLNDAAVTHFVYVGDSIIGNRVNLAAGVKCANLRLDRKDVRIEGRETGLKKFGSIVGDDVQVGCNCVLNPGTLLGKGTICYPLRNVSGLIQPGSIIKDV